MKETIANVTAYIELLTGERVVIEPLKSKDIERLPLYLTGAYELFKGELLGKDICFAIVDKDADTTPAQYSKRGKTLLEITNMVPVFVLENIASYNAQRMTKHRVNFIVPGKQLFLPSLLMDLGKKKEEPTVLVTIPATAQLLILYHLEMGLLHGKTGQEIAATLGTSTASVTRAIQWLTSNGLAVFKGGKTKHLRFLHTGKALWTAACDYMKTPVLKTVRTDTTPDGLICGQNALAEYGMIIEANHKMVAISQKEYRAIKPSTDPLFGENEIQVWAYNPQNLAKIFVVDKLSLYLSMRDNTDERVQKELKTMIEEMIWLED